VNYNVIMREQVIIFVI